MTNDAAKNTENNEEPKKIAIKPPIKLSSPGIKPAQPSPAGEGTPVRPKISLSALKPRPLTTPLRPTPAKDAGSTAPISPKAVPDDPAKHETQASAEPVKPTIRPTITPAASKRPAGGSDSNPVIRPKVNLSGLKPQAPKKVESPSDSSENANNDADKPAAGTTGSSKIKVSPTLKKPVIKPAMKPVIKPLTVAKPTPAVASEEKLEDTAPEKAVPTGVTIAKPAAVKISRPTLTGKPSMARRPMLAKPVITSGEKRSTARIDLPAEVKRKSETVSVPPVEDTPAPVFGAAGKKGIRLKRPAPSITLSPQSKKETARVSLANAKTTATGPKTIKLKRPGGAPISMSKLNQNKENSLDDVVEQAKKSETSRVELPADVDVSTPIKPNIKIKRPSVTLKNNPTESAAKPDLELLNFANEDDTEEQSIVFSLVSLAAAIVIVVLLYFLLGQTFMTDIPMPGLS